MDPNSHKRLADNAFIKANEIFKTNKKEEYKDMIHFAHVARLHYAYSSLDKADEEMNKNIAKADEFIINVYKKLGLFDSALYFEKV
jgi:heterodisulfide reductase subunit B